jgi:hypothetical protein
MVACGVPGVEDEWVVQEPFEDWLGRSSRPGGRDENAGTVLVWRDADGLAQHAAVTLGAGWGFEKPSQEWHSPRAVLPGRDIILAEVASSATPTAVMQLLLVAVGLLAMSYVDRSPLTADLRVAVLLAAPLFLLGLNFANFTIHNGLALLFWVSWLLPVVAIAMLCARRKERSTTDAAAVAMLAALALCTDVVFLRAPLEVRLPDLAVTSGDLEMVEFVPPSIEDAIDMLIWLYRVSGDSPLLVGVGASWNDHLLLRHVDVPVLVKSASIDQHRLRSEFPEAYVTSSTGLSGWREAILGARRADADGNTANR